MSLADLAQNGVLSDPTTFAEYLTLSLNGSPTSDQVAEAMAMVTNVEKSIRQKDTTARVTVTVGFSAEAFSTLFPDADKPADMHDFIELVDGPRHFPSTGGDIFFMIKSDRLDLAYQAAKHLARAFTPIADLVEDVQGFKYLDDRDLIDFVDGTENPTSPERTDWVLRADDPHPGSSYLVVQRYIHHADRWDALPTNEQEDVIGRTKMDDLEQSDADKKPTAHNEKSKVEENGEELKMYRQNRAWGTAAEHGTMFIGFCRTLSILETSLNQMLVADENGDYDKLLDFVDAATGANYFVPPKEFIRSFS